MKITLLRLRSDDEATLGELLIDGLHVCYTLEDQLQLGPKIPGETRIPAGIYELERKAIGTSRFDEKAKSILGNLYLGMLRLIGVKGFSEILIHWGNYEKNTDGCILVGGTNGRDPSGHYAVYRSVDAFKAIYPRIAQAIGCEPVHIEIIDEALA